MRDDQYLEPEESEGGTPALSLLSIRRTIRKRRIRIIIAWIFFSICAAFVVRQLPPVYLAEAVILIDSQKIPEKFVSATVASDVEERIISIRQLLLSGGELKKVIEEFGLYREERKKYVEEEILDMMRKDISITGDAAGLEGKPSSQVKRLAAFRIGFQGKDPALVMRVANRLTDLYVEQNLKTREGQAAGTSDFLGTQLKEAKKHLDEMEAQVKEYKLAHNGELPQQENSLSATLTRLQTELEMNRDAINRAQQTRVVLESSLSAAEVIVAAQTHAMQQALNPDQPAGFPTYPGQPSTWDRRASEALQARLDALRGQYTDSHPDVVKLQGELEKVKQTEARKQATTVAAVLAEPKAGTGTAPKQPVAPLREPPEFARTREQIAGLKAQIMGAETEINSRRSEQKRILEDIDRYQRRVERLPVREQEMLQITRDYEMSKENYKALLDKNMAAEMALNMERRQQSERFIVLDRAQVPDKPIKPKRPLLYAAGTGIGLLLGLLVGFAAEFRRNVVLGEWELPPGTPVLARLPRIEMQKQPTEAKAGKRGWFGRRTVAERASVTGLLLAVAATVCVYPVIGWL